MRSLKYRGSLICRKPSRSYRAKIRGHVIIFEGSEVQSTSYNGAVGAAEVRSKVPRGVSKIAGLPQPENSLRHFSISAIFACCKVEREFGESHLQDFSGCGT